MTERHDYKVADIGSMLDQIVCSCGWESATYFDGLEYAHAEWKKHVADPRKRKIVLRVIAQEVDTAEQVKGREE